MTTQIATITPGAKDPTYVGCMRKDDMQVHIEDTPLFGAIRGGQIVEVTWNDLTEDERQAAYENVFSPNF